MKYTELWAIRKALGHSREYTSTFQRAAAGLTAPRRATADALRSVSGFCELQGIGHPLRRFAALDLGAANRLRLVFGDRHGHIDRPAPSLPIPWRARTIILNVD